MRIPLLFVDVNLGPEKTQRIVVYEGDTSEELAKKFAKEFSNLLLLARRSVPPPSVSAAL